ncbi:MAG: hypothetical protein HY855_25425 [Burkholderiales bacterium]|nr:hypothetical protein [Burkholderiales bacterium]
MTHPTQRAQQVHACLPLFKAQHEAVAAHARHARAGHVMQLGPLDLGALPAGCEPALAASPAELSTRLLQALFGAWPVPPVAPRGAMTCRAPGLTLRELPWQAWLDATSPPAGDERGTA